MICNVTIFMTVNSHKHLNIKNENIIYNMYTFYLIIHIMNIIIYIIN